MLGKRVIGAGLWLGLALPGSAFAQVQPTVTMQPTAPVVVDGGMKPVGMLMQQGNQVVMVPTMAVDALPRESVVQQPATGMVRLVSATPRQARLSTKQASPAVISTPATPTLMLTGAGSGCGLPTACHPCGNQPQLWVRGEYLHWWTKEQSLPPLVTTGDETSVGRLGFEETQVLFGGRQSEDGRSGFRLSVGSWFGVEDPCFCTNRCLGAEVSFFWLSDPSEGFQVSSDGVPILARPIINALTGQSGIEQVANPALVVPGFGTLDPLTGGVSIRQTSQFLGAEVNGLCRWRESVGGTVDLIGGLRFLSLKESLEIREDLFDPVNLEGITVIDSFRPQNRFYGVQVGVRGERRFGSLSLEVTGKVAIGSTREEVEIDGFTQSRLGNDVIAVGRGGLLALDQTNIGKFDRDVFTVVPEITVNASYLVNDNLRVFLGYNFLYWSNVTRPGDHIDIVVNPNFLPSLDPTTPPSRQGQSRPTLLFLGTDFWAQGLNLGAEWRF